MNISIKVVERVIKEELEPGIIVIGAVKTVFFIAVIYDTKNGKSGIVAHLK